MKIKIDNLDFTYGSCMRKGLIREKLVDIELIKSLRKMSKEGLRFIDSKSKDIPKNSDDWTFVFREYYESLRALVEAYLLFENIAIDNHQCKNAYICKMHKNLNLDWEFLETIRLKRNAINYRGQMINYYDWNIFKIQFNSHISILDEQIISKLEA